MKKAMLSQPMAGKTPEEIAAAVAYGLVIIYEE